MNNTAFIVVLGLLTLGPTMPTVPSISLAETAQGPEAMLFSTVGFQSGVIDEVQGSTIRIEATRYSCLPARVSSSRRSPDSTSLRPRKKPSRWPAMPSAGP